MVGLVDLKMFTSLLIFALLESFGECGGHASDVTALQRLARLEEKVFSLENTGKMFKILWKSFRMLLDRTYFSILINIPFLDPSLMHRGRRPRNNTEYVQMFIHWLFYEQLRAVHWIIMHVIQFKPSQNSSVPRTIFSTKEQSLRCWVMFFLFVTNVDLCFICSSMESWQPTNIYKTQLFLL